VYHYHWSVHGGPDGVGMSGTVTVMPVVAESAVSFGGTFRLVTGPEPIDEEDLQWSWNVVRRQPPP
jgi:hypothetical protein